MLTKLDTVTAPTVKSVALPTGVRLEYVEQGDPAGTPVILLHGYSDSWHSYELVLPHLPPSIRAFALTQRGHGDSDRPDAGYDPKDFAADVAAFLDQMGLARAVIVGHSMGSTHAMQFALDYPQRLMGLVLLGAFFDYAANPDVDELAEVVASLEDPVDPAFAREFQQSTLAQPIPPAYFDTVVGESLKLPARVWRAVFQGFENWSLASAEKPIKTPALIVWGDQDAFCPRGDQDALLAHIGGSRVLVYEGAGHAVHWEEPARVAADLAAFVEALQG